MASASHHLYVHLPFCRLVCAYCDFVTVGGRAADIPRYVDALLRELASRPAPGELRTVYLGGGTPSLLAAGQVERLLTAANDRWERVALEEVTLEANPSARERPDWGAMREAGVTRLSLGVQSLDDVDLRTLARGHDAHEARAAFAEVRRAGFASVSLDLIYGIPGQSLERWQTVLREAVALEPDHLSLYALSLALVPDEWAAPPRPGALRWRRRLARELDDDVAADQYRAAEALLAEAGYRHYELSSWARPGHESRHNAAYWARRPYTGIGAGAHSYDGAATRSWNERALDAYLAAVGGDRLPRAGEETLSEGDRRFEAVALGLRRIEGLELAAFAAEFGEPLAARHAAALEESGREGLVTVGPERVALTPRGRLLANRVLARFVEPVDALEEGGRALTSV